MLDTISGYVGGAVAPIVIIVLALGFLLTMKYFATRYKMIPPNMAGVFYGRKYKVMINGKVEDRGFMVLPGGSRILMPLVESYREMSISAFQVTINEDNIPNKDNIKFVVKGVATCRISSKPEDLYQAAGTFLEKTQAQIEEFIRNILKGHLRSIVGTLDINGLLREREKFNKSVIEESAKELAGLGIELVNLVIQDITDAEGYIDALGKQAVASTKSQANIAISNADRETAQTQATNDALIAEAQKDRDVRKARAEIATRNEQAIASKALEIATAAQEETLLVAQATRDTAGAKAQIEVQRQQALRAEQELEATVIKPAQAAKQKAILDADAAAEVLKKTAAAQKEAKVLEGQGDASKLESSLMAKARGEAAGKKEALLAEAEGTEKLAHALREMNDAARLIILLDKLPPLLEHGGDAMAKVMQAIFASVAAPLGQIDKLEIIDVGGTGRGVDQVAQMVPNVVFKFIAAAKAQGIDVGGLLSKFGVDPSKALSMLGGLSGSDASTAAQVPPAAPPVVGPNSMDGGKV